MTIGITDTDPRAEHVQIELLRAASVAQRVRVARALTATTRALALRALRRANPDSDDDEIAVKFVALQYGQEPASHLEAHLRGRRG